jgi:uncharacterized Zn finger protein (UPF0148 family)
MDELKNIEFRYRTVESKLSCPVCEEDITTLARSSDAELFSTDTGVALKILIPFTGPFYKTDGKLMCHRCRKRAEKENPKTDLAKDLESLEAKIKKKLADPADSTGEAESRWRQAQAILQTLHDLVEGP